MGKLLECIRAAWKALFGRPEWRSARLDGGDLVSIRRQYDRVAREEQFPFG